MAIPPYPDFTPISLDLKNEMHTKLSLTPDGVSEFTFAGLYLFRKRYQYCVSKLEDKTFILSGIQPPHSADEK
ncbi:MAG: ABC transporter permease, partial [Treponema sp.]|nr:ABC transporter permease [Treponema sp.]